jgi:co-chaperonin GroES (HSP10)
MQIKPFGTRVVARRIELVKQSEAGIITATAYAQKNISNAGEIVYVGPDVTKVKPGDKVMFVTAGGIEFMGEQLVTAYESEILGLIE